MSISDSNAFSGQQEGERILFSFAPHALRFYTHFSIILLIGLLLSFGSVVLAQRLPELESSLRFFRLILLAVLILGGTWWARMLALRTRTYLTDRRIIRVEPAFPWFEKRRSLFWNEVTKAKAYAPTIAHRFLNVGTVSVMPFAANYEDIRVPATYYFDDIANYIDKIIFLHKNRPEELNELRPFVLKPKGKRH